MGEWVGRENFHSVNLLFSKLIEVSVTLSFYVGPGVEVSVSFGRTGVSSDIEGTSKRISLSDMADYTVSHVPSVFF